MVDIRLLIALMVSLEAPNFKSAEFFMSQHSPKQWFNLEERFFSEIDHQLVEKMRSEMATKQNAEAITHVLGINDQRLATEIATLDVTVETLAAFRLVPLVAVAWADDRVEESERYAITTAAEKSGIQKDSAAMDLIATWIKRRPPADLLETWCDYAKSLSASLDEAHRTTLKDEILEQVNAVASAAGGVLGFGSISPGEKATIEKISDSLS